MMNGLSLLTVACLCLCRVICLCAQFEAVLQHGLRKSRGLALTAAALKQAAGFSSKVEAGTTLNWLCVLLNSGLKLKIKITAVALPWKKVTFEW